ncbi:cytochrome P450 9e2-like [Athalia rosae]|uniref:cytochrome P450 9e2-like n=1 Tax=Athalia rosae TaxID=37344 RepID=UPI0020336C5A|nr:cytochrome P450 9e2-like [Athalia rosae]
MDPWTILSTILVGAVVLYLFYVRNYSYFKRHGIPYVTPLPIFGNMAKVVFKKESMMHAIQRTYKLNPDAKYVGFYYFGTPVILLRDPELLKLIAIKHFDVFPNRKMFADFPAEPLLRRTLFTLHNDEWRTMRSLLSPAFSAGKMKMMFEIVRECGTNFGEYMANRRVQPEGFDMKDVLKRYTLDVIASTAFGLSTNSLEEPDNKFYEVGVKVTDFFSYLQIIRVFILRSFPSVARLFNIKFVDGESANFFKNVIKNTIETRDREGIVRPDMIHLLMQARDKQDKLTPTLDDMTAQGLMFLMAGLEGSTVAMCFVAQILALEPEVQKKLHAEIDEVLKENPERVSYEQINAMKYLEAVISESLRVFTTNFLVDRVCTEEFTLPPALPGLEPLRIQPSQNLWIPIYSIHRDEKNFPNPDKFDPERFSDENKSNFNSSAYIPFGLGPRICVASRYALMLVKLAIFNLLAKCDLLPGTKTHPRIEYKTDAFALEPQGGFWLKVQPRK